MADEVIPPYPNLDVAELSYRLLTPSLSHLHGAAQASLLEAIKADEMGPYYRSLYDTPNITINALASPRIPQSPRLARAQLESGPLGRRNDTLLAQLDETNQKTLDEFEEKIKEAEKTEGESEIGEAWRAKALYLTRIGEKVSPALDVQIMRNVFMSTVGKSHRGSEDRLRENSGRWIEDRHRPDIGPHWIFLRTPRAHQGVPGKG